MHEIDGHDPEAVKKAIQEAQSVKDKPSLIVCRTTIGFGSPNKAGKEEAHGAALGEEEVALTRQKLGWKHPAFEIPKEIYRAWDARETGEKAQQAWNEKFAAYKKAYPELAAEFNRRMSGGLPEDWEEKTQALIENLQSNPAKIATRKASQNTLNAIGPVLPELLGGSADLAPSNLTIWSGSKSLKEDIAGNYIHYGVREFGMTAIANGIAHHGGFVPYTATFLMFVEYARNAARMAALLNKRGTISMARTADKDSATSQFFLNVADNAFLDHGQRDFGYAVFGKVVKGMDVADKISQVQTHDVGPYQNVPSKPVVILSAKVLP